MKHGREVFLVEAVRTPLGKGRPGKGALSSVHPVTLLGKVFTDVLRRAGVGSEHVDNAIAGCVYQIAEQSGGVTRWAWLQEGLDHTTGAVTVDVRCGSSQQAVHYAASQIAVGADEVIVVGGVESMSRVGFPAQAGAIEQWGDPMTQQLLDLYDLQPQGLCAELIADRWGIGRTEMDGLSLRSHQRAAAATDAGDFAREILPIETEAGTVDRDEGIRAEATLESLGALKPVFREDGRVTAGNSSQITDGAVALMLASAEAVERLGLRPRARIVDQVVLGVDPETMLTGPIPATQRLLERNGMAIGDIDVVEINEAFAPVVLAWQRELGADLERVNRRGGAIALGHPLGMTGGRLIAAVIHQLEDYDGEFGLATMCCGGGIGTGTLLQRV
jgi:acetyl-CoA acyltransferase